MFFFLSPQITMLNSPTEFHGTDKEGIKHMTSIGTPIGGHV